MPTMKIVYCFLAIIVVCQAVDFSKYKNSFLLSDKTNYTIFWRVEDNELRFVLTANTTGWLGFGFSESTSGSMPGSDIVIAEIDASGHGKLTDRHAMGFIYPVADTCQDYKLLSYEKTSSSVTFELKRALNTGDKQDREIIPGPTRIVYAHGLDDQHTLTYHDDRRAGLSITFIPSTSEESQLPPNTKSVKLNFDLIIPAEETNYQCASFILPTMEDTKYQIVQINPILDPTTTEYVHHLVVIFCRTPRAPQFKYYFNHPGDSCLHNPILGNASMNEDDYDMNEYCVDYVYAWAVGMGPLVLPPNAGFPMSDDAIKYVVVQMHYTNPKLTPNIRDQSGIEIVYITENLREHDAGVLILGDPNLDFPDIPPNEKALHLEANCPAECTQMWDHEIHVFGDFEHMHFLGRKMWTTHWRGDALISQLNGIEFYDYGYQQITPIDRFTTIIKPGDRLNTHCVFNSEDRVNATRFGPASVEEMCMDFVFYYPLLEHKGFCGNLGTDLTVCGDPTFDGNVIPLPNPTIRDPVDLVRKGADFGDASPICQQNGDSDDDSDDGSDDDSDDDSSEHTGSKVRWILVTVFVCVGSLVIIAAVILWLTRNSLKKFNLFGRNYTVVNPETELEASI